MEIAGLRLITKFKRTYADARNPLDEWINRVTTAKWKTPVDIKRMFSTVSFVKHFVIFNIGGNKYRLLTEIRYEIGRVIVLQVGTHTEYDRWKL